jgi:2-methylisocitrate lyase-like PEP mutase family enzyme
MGKSEEMAKRLRDLLSRKQILIVPGAYDGISAKVIEKEGFEAIFLSGAGVASSLLGQPDVGLVTMSEIVMMTKYIAHCVDIPILVDTDTGYGNPLNVWRTTKELEIAGAAGIVIEDQVFPKKCGHFGGKEFISAEEMTYKIKAIREASAQLVILTKCDVNSVYGLEEAIRRSNIYKEAGADIVFIDTPKNLDEMKEIRKRIDGWVSAAIQRSDRMGLFSKKSLEELGFNMAVLQILFYAAQVAFTHVLREFKKSNNGSIENFIDKVSGLSEFMRLMGIEKINELEKKFNLKVSSV